MNILSFLAIHADTRNYKDHHRLLSSEWSDFFDSSINPKRIHYLNDQTVTDDGNSNYYLLSCKYKNVPNAISLKSDSEKKLLVEYCTFDSCQSSTSGGSIYFTKGEFAMNYCYCKKPRIDFTPSNYGAFTYIAGSTKGQSKIKFYYSTCEQGSDARGEIYLKIGDADIKNTNHSFSRVNLGVIFINMDISWKITYSNIKENIVVSSILSFSSSGKMSYTNFENNQNNPSELHGQIYAAAQKGQTILVEMEKCNIINDQTTGNHFTFWGEHSYFAAYNCYIKPNDWVRLPQSSNKQVSHSIALNEPIELTASYIKEDDAFKPSPKPLPPRTEPPRTAIPPATENKPLPPPDSFKTDKMTIDKVSKIRSRRYNQMIN